MGGIRLEVAPVSIFCRAVQVVILVNQLHELFLDRSQFFNWKFVLIGLYLLKLKESDKSKFVLHQEHQSFPSTFLTSAGSTDAMDIIIRIIWRIVLDNPVNFRKVKTSLRNVGTK